MHPTRIYNIRATGEVFARRDDEWSTFAGALGVVGGLRSESTVDVNVGFSPEVADYVMRHPWTNGILPDLLRWRRHALIMGGPELREALVEELEIMTQLYKE